MQDLHADSARAVDLRVPGPGRLAVLLKVDHDEVGEITVDVVSHEFAPTGDDLQNMMVMNVPDSVRRTIGIAGVVEIAGVDEESIGEYIIAGDFPAAVQLRGTKRKLWWLHEVVAWHNAHIIPGDAENYSLGGRRRPGRNRNTLLNARNKRPKKAEGGSAATVG
jgi:hypothetical protein